MLDILESLNKVEKKAKETLTFNCVAFTQSEKCRVLIEEAFRFDGLVPPVSLPNTDADIQAHVRQSEIEIVLVELNDSQNVTKICSVSVIYYPTTPQSLSWGKRMQYRPFVI
ncbi:hypothetical protein [Vibrio taketomensis]|uniref:hypothetical protein n=1 Tax=Vibrio taketomensis TaxID=2572923 RepID=UPI001E2C042C|nr:hypothetical protein [Vibrio taketomensis]